MSSEFGLFDSLFLFPSRAALAYRNRACHAWLFYFPPLPFIATVMEPGIFRYYIYSLIGR